MQGGEGQGRPRRHFPVLHCCQSLRTIVVRRRLEVPRQVLYCTTVGSANSAQGARAMPGRMRSVQTRSRHRPIVGRRCFGCRWPANSSAAWRSGTISNLQSGPLFGWRPPRPHGPSSPPAKVESAKVRKCEIINPTIDHQLHGDVGEDSWLSTHTALLVCTTNSASAPVHVSRIVFLLFPLTPA
jgi:hypothetical protein